MVIVEARLAADGSVADATVVQSASAFDDPARATARRFQFRPARREGQDVPSVVVLVFGFRQPVTGADLGLPGRGRRSRGRPGAGNTAPEARGGGAVAGMSRPDMVLR